MIADDVKGVDCLVLERQSVAFSFVSRIYQPVIDLARDEDMHNTLNEELKVAPNFAEVSRVFKVNMAHDLHNFVHLNFFSILWRPKDTHGAMILFIVQYYTT